MQIHDRPLWSTHTGRFCNGNGTSGLKAAIPEANTCRKTVPYLWKSIMQITRSHWWQYHLAITSNIVRCNKMAPMRGDRLTWLCSESKCLPWHQPSFISTHCRDDQTMFIWSFFPRLLFSANDIYSMSLVEKNVEKDRCQKSSTLWKQHLPFLLLTINVYDD